MGPIASIRGVTFSSFFTIDEHETGCRGRCQCPIAYRLVIRAWRGGLTAHEHRTSTIAIGTLGARQRRRCADASMLFSRPSSDPPTGRRSPPCGGQHLCGSGKEGCRTRTNSTAAHSLRSRLEGAVELGSELAEKSRGKSATRGAGAGPKHRHRSGEPCFNMVEHVDRDTLLLFVRQCTGVMETFEHVLERQQESCNERPRSLVHVWGGLGQKPRLQSPGPTAVTAETQAHSREQPLGKVSFCAGGKTFEQGRSEHGCRSPGLYGCHRRPAAFPRICHSR